MRKIALLMAAGLIAGPACAVENEAAAPPDAVAAPAETPAAAPAAAEHSPGEPAGKAKAARAEAQDKNRNKDKKQAEKAKPAVSKQAYVELLAAEIKRHTPKSSDQQSGSIHVAFTVGAGGRIVSHKVQSASNPALEPVVDHILAAVHTVPPPGGSFSAVQEFNFH